MIFHLFIKTTSLLCIMAYFSPMQFWFNWVFNLTWNDVKYYLIKKSEVQIRALFLFFDKNLHMCHISQVEKTICKNSPKFWKNGANMFNIPVKINANIMAWMNDGLHGFYTFLLLWIHCMPKWVWQLMLLSFFFFFFLQLIWLLGTSYVVFCCRPNH